MKKLFMIRKKVSFVNLMRQGFFDGWDKEDIQAYMEHLIDAGKRKRTIGREVDALNRMTKRGCRPCEKKMQEKYIKRLMDGEI